MMYVKAMIVPALGTLTSIIIYAEVVRIFAPNQYADAAIAALLAIITAAISALLQLRPLLNDSALLSVGFKSTPSAA